MSENSPITTIKKALESATGPDRAIDRDIAEHIVGTKYRSTSRGREWLDDSHGGLDTWSRHPTPYTGSIDAAIGLIEKLLPDAELEISNLYGVARVTLHDVENSFHGSDPRNRINTALLIALFSALEANAAAEPAHLNASTGAEHHV